MAYTSDSVGFKYATRDGGIGADKYLSNIKEYATQAQKDNATDADLAKAMDTWGVNAQDYAQAIGGDATEIQRRYDAVKNPVAPVAPVTPVNPPTPGIINNTLAPQSTLTVDPNTMTVQGQMKNLIDPNNALNQQITANVMGQMNERGLINSSIAQTNAQDAILKNAANIAQADANTYYQTGVTNNAYANQFARDNNMQIRDLQKMATQHGYDLENMSAQQINDLAKMSTQQGYTQQNLATQQTYDLAKMGTQYGFDLNKMDKQAQITLGQMGAQQANDLARMAKQQGYTLESMTADQVNKMAQIAQNQTNNQANIALQGQLQTSLATLNNDAQFKNLGVSSQNSILQQVNSMTNNVLMNDKMDSAAKTDALNQIYANAQNQINTLAATSGLKLANILNPYAGITDTTTYAPTTSSGGIINQAIGDNGVGIGNGP